ncbi:MAG TPA: CBS domain-containing protein [Thermomicrobiaceae bacterium]|nr:CBS domain-containing protein [Thermomicrobiaceae bacterium]
MDIDSSIAPLMRRRVISVERTTPVSEVARLLWEHQLSGVPVVDGTHVVGMITEFDLIARDSEWDAPLYIPFLDAYFRIPGSAHEDQLRRILATTAGELMTEPATTATPESTVQEVATLMYEHQVNPVPIVDGRGDLVGIVSRADIIRLMVVEEELHAEEDTGTT